MIKGRKIINIHFGIGMGTEGKCFMIVIWKVGATAHAVRRPGVLYLSDQDLYHMLFQVDVLITYAAPNFSGNSSKSSAESISMTFPTSAVFLINSFAPAYSILNSALQVTGR